MPERKAFLLRIDPEVLDAVHEFYDLGAAVNHALAHK